MKVVLQDWQHFSRLTRKSFKSWERCFDSAVAAHLRLKFLDFPIFLDLNGSARLTHVVLTVRILRESSKLARGHDNCQNPARRGLFKAARFSNFFGAVNKKGDFSQEGAAPLSSSRKESRK